MTGQGVLLLVLGVSVSIMYYMLANKTTIEIIQNNLIEKYNREIVISNAKTGIFIAMNKIWADPNSIDGQSLSSGSEVKLNSITFNKQNIDVYVKLDGSTYNIRSRCESNFTDLYGKKMINEMKVQLVKARWDQFLVYTQNPYLNDMWGGHYGAITTTGFTPYDEAWGPIYSGGDLFVYGGIPTTDKTGPQPLFYGTALTKNIKSGTTNGISVTSWGVSSGYTCSDPSYQLTEGGVNYVMPSTLDEFNKLFPNPDIKSDEKVEMQNWTTYPLKYNKVLHGASTTKLVNNSIYVFNMELKGDKVSVWVNNASGTKIYCVLHGSGEEVRNMPISTFTGKTIWVQGCDLIIWGNTDNSWVSPSTETVIKQTRSIPCLDGILNVVCTRSGTDGGNIWITGNLYCKNNPQIDPVNNSMQVGVNKEPIESVKCDDMLRIFSEGSVIIADIDPAVYSGTKNLGDTNRIYPALQHKRIEATIYCHDGALCTYSPWLRRALTTAEQKQLYLFGALTQKYGGVIGGFDFDVQTSGSARYYKGGYCKKYYYDKRVLNEPYCSYPSPTYVSEKMFKIRDWQIKWLTN